MKRMEVKFMSKQIKSIIDKYIKSNKEKSNEVSLLVNISQLSH